MGKKLELPQITMPVDHFKVFPGFVHYKGKKRGHYLDVLVFETKADMDAFGNSMNTMGPDMTDVAACVINSKKKNRLGVMCFYKPRLGAGLVSHEALHAAMRWMKAMGFDKELSKYPTIDDYHEAVKGNYDYETCPEELLAYSTGEVVRQLYDEFFKRKIIE